MPPKWTELAASPEFQSLPPEVREKTRVDFFNQHVAPTVAPDRMAIVRQDWDARTLPKPAAPAPNVANQDSNVTSPTALRRPGAPAPAPGAAGFVEGVKDFGRGLASGTVENLPSAAANLADYADTPEFDAAGKKLGDAGAASKWAQGVKADAGRRGEGWQQSEFGRQMQEKDAFSVRGAAYEAGKNLPLSFGPGLVGAAIGARIAGIPGAAAGYIGGSLIAGLPLFFGQQAKDTYDKVYEATRATNPDLTDEQIHDTAMQAGALTGGVEAGGELVADLVGAKLFKMIPTGTKKGLVKAATKGFQGAVPMIKGLAQVLGAEVGTELAQGSAQAEIEQAYGVGEGATWNNQKGVIMPTILMTLVGGGGAAGMSAHQRYRTAKILQNPNLPPEERMAAAKGVADVIHGEDAELAQLFYDSAAKQIEARQPVIAKDDRFYRDLKPLEQREIDKRMAAGDFSDPTPVAQSEKNNPVSATPPTFEEVDQPGEPIITPPPADVSAENTPVTSVTSPQDAPPSQAPEAAEGGAATPPPRTVGMSRPMRQTYMADISAQLKVAREERKAAQAAGDEQAIAEIDGEIRAIAENFKLVSNGQPPRKTPRQAKQAPEPSAWAGQGAAAAAAPEAPKTVLQNRDRSTPASIEQMTSIAANPDYTRLGFSRDFANGAPVVEPGADIPEQNLGKQDVATTASGRQIPVQYAVVDADQLLPSNRADGTPVAEYQQGMAGLSRSIAGNGRVAGLQRAYEQGTAAGYTDGVAADAALHGVPEASVRAMAKPVLVRIMPQEEITDTIGDESNTSGTAELSPAEQARNDSRRIDVTAVKLDDSGRPTKEAVDQFIASMPTAERAGLLDGKLPNRRAYERLGNAVFAQAYESDELLRLAAEATTPEAENIISGLKIAAGKLSRLKGTGPYDIRGLVIEAAETAINAGRNGQTLSDYLAQGDMGRNGAVLPILEMLAKNIRSSKKIGAALSSLADTFYNEASRPDADMFGAVDKRSPQQLLDETYGTNTEGQPADQEGAGDTAGPEAAAGGDGGQAVAGVKQPAGESERPIQEIVEPFGIENDVFGLMEASPGISVKEIARQLKIPEQMVRDIIANKDSNFIALDEPMSLGPRTNPDIKETTGAAQTAAGDAPALELPQETEAERQAREKAEKDKADQDAAAQAKKDKEAADAKQAEDDKKRADETVDDFQLGQTADQQLSGQANIFDLPPDQNPDLTDRLTKQRDRLSKIRAMFDDKDRDLAKRQTDKIDVVLAGIDSALATGKDLNDLPTDKDFDILVNQMVKKATNMRSQAAADEFNAGIEAKQKEKEEKLKVEGDLAKPLTDLFSIPGVEQTAGGVPVKWWNELQGAGIDWSPAVAYAESLRQRLNEHGVYDSTQAHKANGVQGLSGMGSVSGTIERLARDLASFLRDDKRQDAETRMENILRNSAMLGIDPSPVISTATITEEVQDEDGNTLKVTQKVDAALRQMDKRLSVIDSLLGCLQ